MRKPLFKNHKWFWRSAVVFLLVYAFILISVIYLGENHNHHLQSFDLNRDGYFSQNEQTPEQQKAMRKVTGDNARNFAHIAGLVYASIVTLISFLIGKTFEKLLKKAQSIKINTKTSN